MKNGKVWVGIENNGGRTKTRGKTKAVKPTQFGNRRIACVFLRATERGQYAGIIEGNQNIYIVSDFRSDCQPEKNGWYLCLTPEQGQRHLFFYDRKPVYAVKTLAAITSWKSSVNSETFANSQSLAPNDLIEKDDVVLFFEKNGDYIIWIRDPKERIAVLQELNKKEEEDMHHKNQWTKKHGFIFSPRAILSSCLDRREIIRIVFG